MLRIFLYSATLVFFILAGVYSWKYHARFATSDFVALVALVVSGVAIVVTLRDYSGFSTVDLVALSMLAVSAVVATVTFFTQSTPPEVEAFGYDITVTKVPEGNAADLRQQAAALDILRGITPEGRDLANDLRQQLGELPQTPQELIETLDGREIRYPKINNIDDAVLRELIGRGPYLVPLVIGCEFVNHSPRGTVINELVLTLETSQAKFIYRPSFTIDSEKFFTSPPAKMVESFETTFRPFFVPGNSEHWEHILFTKVKAYNADGSEDNERQLLADKYKITLHYRYSGVSKTSSVRTNFWLKEKTLIESAKGNIQSFAHVGELQPLLERKFGRTK